MRKIFNHFSRNIFLVKIALSFLTRYPLFSRQQHFSTQDMQASRSYFGLAGIVLGFNAWIWFVLLHQWLPSTTSLLLALIIMLWTTGALHEDALADAADSIAGKTVEQRLSIMKETHLGTYGVLALISSFLLRYSLLLTWVDQPVELLKMLCLGNALSRTLMLMPLTRLNYLQNVNSRQQVWCTALTTKNLYLLLLIAASLVFLTVGMIALVLVAGISIILFLIVCYVLKRYYKGLTGDLLGAIQQISELSIYILFTLK